MENHLFKLSLLALGLAASGCSPIGPDFKSPETITPDSWNQQVKGELNSSRDQLDKWWTRYNDASLNRLISTAREKNQSLKIAAERLNQARAQRIQAASPLYPNLFGTGGVSRSRNSENAGLPEGVGGQTLDLWNAGFDATWEIDFFGTLRRGVEAAEANEAARVEQLRDVLVSLDAETTLAFLEIRTVEAQIKIFNDNLKNQLKSLDLAKARFEAGLVPEIDVTQARTNVENTRSALPTLRQQRTATLNRLAVLIGGYPGSASKILQSGAIPLPSKNTGLGLPADLLRNRPDVRASERLVAAQNARIGVAMGDLYPRFGLNGNFRFESLNSGDLADSGSRAYGFGPSFRWNLFNAGLVRNRVIEEQSRTREAILQYQETVLSAVSEVETNLASVLNERDRNNILSDSVDAAKKTVALVKVNYTEGNVPFQNVLDAERVLLDAENNLAVSRGLIAAGYARLFKSLGGGVVSPPVNTTPNQSK
jgi:NodT family efflux transporter outer membrane factor (OMF) lipoprotein